MYPQETHQLANDLEEGEESKQEEGADPGQRSEEAPPLFLKILFIHERYRERGRDIGRERSRLHTGSLMQDSTPRPRSCPEPKADAQPLSHPGGQERTF